MYGPRPFRPHPVFLFVSITMLSSCALFRLSAFNKISNFVVSLMAVLKAFRIVYRCMVNLVWWDPVYIGEYVSCHYCPGSVLGRIHSRVTGHRRNSVEICVVCNHLLCSQLRQDRTMAFWIHETEYRIRY